MEHGDYLKKYWNYDTFLPFQEEAILSVCKHHDSVVVLPTGGGKSLCYQIPALMIEGVAVVISPLIALMKDQVDTLLSKGIKAVRLDSSLSQIDYDQTVTKLQDQHYKILYLSPERIMSKGFIELLQKINISFFAIDESHCISIWGHNFRPDYRMLGLLKESFPTKSIHAYTASGANILSSMSAIAFPLISAILFIAFINPARVISDDIDAVTHNHL